MNTTFVPGYVGNQRIEATRRNRRRWLVRLFLSGLGAALAAAVLLSFVGCGVEKECGEEMRTKNDETDIFQLQRAFASVGTTNTLSLELQVPDVRIHWSIRNFFVAAPPANPFASVPNPPAADYFPAPSTGVLSWTIYPIAPEGKVAKYEAIRTADLPDAWEEDGSAAERLAVDVTYTEADWQVYFGVPPGPAVPVATMWVRATFSPAAGACFGPGEYEKILEKCHLRRLYPVVPIYGVW